MVVSENIPMSIDAIIDEILERQKAPWNDGRINDYIEFPSLGKLFQLLNSGIPKEDFFYRGDLFRLHSSYVTCLSHINLHKEEIIGKVCSDGSCSVLPVTEYSNKLVAFSKSPDFTNQQVFYKVFPESKARLIHINTKLHYGIDVNCFLHRYGIENRYEQEQEVLFPLKEEFIVKEYFGTPNKFKYYLRQYIAK